MENLSVTPPTPDKSFSPMRGLWAISTPASPGAVKGVVRSSDIVLKNNAAADVEVVVDHRNYWGGISASYTLDFMGRPKPILLQHYLNYPEKVALGEDDGARQYNRFIVPANDVVEYTFQTFYNGGATNSSGFHYDRIQRDSLNYDPNLHAISHYTINRYEALTLRHDPILATDWRKHPDNLREEFTVLNSASAADTTFLRIELSSGTLLELKAKNVEVLQSGPLFAEEIYGVESVPGGITGTIRFCNAAWMDEEYGTVPFGEGHSRFGAEVNLIVTQAFSVNTSADIPISVLGMRCNPPALYNYFEFSSPSDDTTSISLLGDRHQTYTPSQPFYVGFYQAQNNIWRNSSTGGPPFLIPFSDVAGNPFHAVWDWDVVINGSAVTPRLELDAETPPSNPYYREFNVIPSSIPSTIKAGSKIAFKMMATTGGDENSDDTFGETHFNTWKNISVTVVKGTLLSEFPPKVLADSNGEAEFSVSGGTEWMPVTVVGINPDTSRLKVEAGINFASLANMSSLVDGEPWYQINPYGTNDLASVTIPVKTSDTILPLDRYVRVSDEPRTDANIFSIWLDSGIIAESSNDSSPFAINDRDKTWTILAKDQPGIWDVGAAAMTVRMITFNTDGNSRAMQTGGGNGLAVSGGGNNQWMDGSVGESAVFKLNFYRDSEKTVEIEDLNITFKSIVSRIHTSGQNLAIDAYAGSGLLDISALNDTGTVSLNGENLTTPNDLNNSFAADIGVLNPTPDFTHNTLPATGSVIFGKNDSFWLRRRNLLGGDMAYQLGAVTFKLTKVSKFGNIYFKPIPGTNAFTISWPTLAGTNYWLESTTNLMNATWTRIKTVIGTGNNVTITNMITTNRHFYRVISEE